jgi:S1-C subfamily serine protease
MLNTVLAFSISGSVSTSVAATLAEIQNSNQNSVVYLEINGGGKNGSPFAIDATGFLVSDTGEILTANHIFKTPEGQDLNPISIRGWPGTRFEGRREIEILDTAPNLDLALLRFKGNKTDYKPVRICPNLQSAVGDKLAAIGFPRGSELSMIDGILSNKASIKGWHQTNVDFIQGYSGGPVFETEIGAVIGIVMGGTPEVAGRNFYLPINRANNLLNQLASRPPCDENVKQAVTVSDGNLNYGQSGFSFRHRSLVGWNSEEGDILVATGNPKREGDSLFFMPYDAPPYNGPNDKRARSGISQIDTSRYSDHSACAGVGFTYHWRPASANQAFCVRSRKGDDFYKILVRSVTKDYISFEWKKP